MVYVQDSMGPLDDKVGLLSHAVNINTQSIFQLATASMNRTVRLV